MTISNAKRMVVLILCIGIPYLWAASIRSASHGLVRANDFGAVYYGARCVLQHKDPYDPATALHEFEADGGKFAAKDPKQEKSDLSVISEEVYPPTALLLVSPLARLRWPLLQTVWLTLIAGLLVLAAFLMWDLAAQSPAVAGWMLGFVLLNCVILLLSGNLVGVVAPSCAIAAWCFLKDRLAWAGVALFAVSLVLKPHDAGFVWLYFLLAGGAGRKRALCSLAGAAILGMYAAIWVLPASPHWYAELHRNLTLVSIRGNISDPGPSGLSSRSISPIISLQGAISIFEGDPTLYNCVTHLLAGGLILTWAVTALRKRASKEASLLALAAISILTMLPVYHRADDAKLLLLVIPACAMLWKSKGRTGWLAINLTAAAVFVTSAVPIIFEAAAVANLPLEFSTMSGKLTLLLLQPAPLVLLAAGCFYLWEYIRYEPAPYVSQREDAATNPLTSAAT